MAERDVRPDGGPTGRGGTLIDLGELPRGPEPAGGAPPRAPAAGRSRAGGRTRPRSRRGWLAAATAVLALAGLGAAAVPTPVPAAIRVAFVPRSRGDATFGLDGDLLYVVAPPPVASTRVYRVGARLVPWPRGYRGDYLATTAGTVLLQYGDLCPDRVDGTIQAVDAATGAVRWTRDAADAGPVADGWLLAERSPTEGPCTAPGAVVTPSGPTGPAALATTTLDVVDVAGGGVAWTLRARRSPGPTVGPGPDGRPAVLAVEPAGTWTRRDLATGAPVAATGVPAASPTGPPGWAPWTGTPPLPPVDRVPGVATWGWAVQLPAGVLVVSGAAGRTVVSLLDGTSLRPRWTVSLPVPWPVQVTGCGPRICVWSPGGTLALDTGTGRTAWRSPWYVTQPVGTRWALAATASAADTPVALLDLDSGRVVARLSGWRVAGGQPAAGLDMYTGGPGAADGPDVAQPAGDGVLLYGSQPGRTWFARLDPGNHPAEPRVVAVAPVELRACVAAGRYVACRSDTGSGVVSLWRLPG